MEQQLLMMKFMLPMRLVLLSIIIIPTIQALALVPMDIFGWEVVSQLLILILQSAVHQLTLMARAQLAEPSARWAGIYSKDLRHHLEK